MDIALIVVLTLVGVALLVVEMFLIPGVGVAGLAGVGCLAGSVCWAYFRVSAMAGHITLGAALLLSLIAIIIFLRSRALDKMTLDTQIDSSVKLAEPGKKIENLKK